MIILSNNKMKYSHLFSRISSKVNKFKVNKMNFNNKNYNNNNSSHIYIKPKQLLIFNKKSNNKNNNCHTNNNYFWNIKICRTVIYIIWSVVCSKKKNPMMCLE